MVVFIPVGPAGSKGEAIAGIIGGILLIGVGIWIIPWWVWLGVAAIIFGISMICWGGTGLDRVLRQESPSLLKQKNWYDLGHEKQPPLRSVIPPDPGIKEGVYPPRFARVVEEGEYVVVTLGLPYVARDAIEVEIHGRALVVRAVMAASRSNYHYQKVLPVPVRQEGVKGRFQAGTLTLTLPKQTDVASGEYSDDSGGKTSREHSGRGIHIFVRGVICLEIELGMGWDFGAPSRNLVGVGRNKPLGGKLQDDSHEDIYSIFSGDFPAASKDEHPQE